MRYLSLFSGIEAASVAWEPLGWQCVGVSEIKPFACAVLKHRYPDVPNLGDVRHIDSQALKRLGRFDLVVMGSPCVDFSMSGNRKGLKGERSSLVHEGIRIATEAAKINKCRFLLWENVDGVLHSRQGEDFKEIIESFCGCHIGAVPESGWRQAGTAYGASALCEWRVLDARCFGLPQYRKRLFALCDFGAWFERKPVLLVPQRQERVAGVDEEKRQEDTASVESVDWGIDSERNFRREAIGALKALGNPPLVVIESKRGITARRITPLEMERLQGFPSGWTDIQWQGKPASEKMRRDVLGNSMAVPVMGWIGERIAECQR